MTDALSNQCMKWGYDEWENFDTPVFQARFKKLSKPEQEKVLMQKKLFWECFEATDNPIADGENLEPENSYDEFIEETRKKQERFIKERGASFVFYNSFVEALEDMSDADFRACIMALSDYGLHSKKGEYKGVVKMYMIQAIPQLDANERKRLIAKQNGKNGGAPEGNQNARKQPKTTQNNQ
jgi:hypothetical protein